MLRPVTREIQYGILFIHNYISLRDREKERDRETYRVFCSIGAQRKETITRSYVIAFYVYERERQT